METIIDAVEEAIKKEEWNLDYHQSLSDKACVKLHRLKQELQTLKGIFETTTIGVEPELITDEALLQHCQAEGQQLQMAG